MSPRTWMLAQSQTGVRCSRVLRESPPGTLLRTSWRAWQCSWITRQRAFTPAPVTSHPAHMCLRWTFPAPTWMLPLPRRMLPSSGYPNSLCHGDLPLSSRLLVRFCHLDLGLAMGEPLCPSSRCGVSRTALRCQSWWRMGLPADWRR